MNETPESEFANLDVPELLRFTARMDDSKPTIAALLNHAADKLTAATAEIAALRVDKARLDVLESALVQLRLFGTHLKGGSPNELRNAADRELAALDAATKPKT